MSVNVPSDALEGSFSFDVVATTGDVERRATLTVVTLFGLIPECTATIQGTVTDELGNPIVGAEFDPTIRAPTAFTGADGTFSIDAILPRGATIEKFVWDVIGPSGDTSLHPVPRGVRTMPGAARRPMINPVMEVVPDATGLTMRAVVGIENPVQPTRPLATDEPMSGATLTIRYTPERFPIEKDMGSNADGSVLFADVPTSNTQGNRRSRTPSRLPSSATGRSPGRSG